MTVRSLDFLDLPLLPRFGRDLLVLDSAQALTQGSLLGVRTLLASLVPHHPLHTAVCMQDGLALIGQIVLKEDEASARLTFLAPSERVPDLALPLLDHLAAHSGEWGALHLLSEVDENQPAFNALRQAGFAMYARQRVWKLAEVTAQTVDNGWQPAGDADWNTVQSLHAQIVPALIQPVAPLPKLPSGLVCRTQTGLQAYVGVTRGSRGIWLQPLIPPDSSCPAARLASLVQYVQAGTHLPVYLCVRSYQAWLEAGLSELGALAHPPQAVMVRRLARTIKESQLIRSPEKNLAKAKPAAPVARSTSER